MKMRDIVRKHKRELQKAQRTGQLELSPKAEQDLMNWAMDNGEVNTDDEDDFIEWLDNNLDDILKGRIREMNEARLSRKEQIIADAERKLNFKIKELQYLKMKKEMETEGLWANIHAKRARGERMRKKGEKGAPTADAMAKAKAGSKNGSTSEAVKLAPSQKPMMKRVKARFPRLKTDTQQEIVMLVKPGSQINSRRFVELGQAYDDMDMKKLDQLITKYTADDVKRNR
mgnify:CR=1 FL=1